MRAPVYGLDGSKKGNITIPGVFSTPFRPDIIHRVFTILSTHTIQPQGRDPLAGERTSALSWGVGRGVARLARVKGERHPRAGQAAGIASVVKGRQAHPPKARKKIFRAINRKERQIAIASAISATSNRELVSLRGHRLDRIPYLPLIVVDDLGGVTKARDLRSFFQNLGLDDDVMRVAQSVKHQSGKSRMRGRRKKMAKGPLFVFSEDKGLGKAIRSYPGIECVLAKDLSVLHLAPGSHPGRLVVWTKSAVGQLSKPVLKVGERVAV